MENQIEQKSELSNIKGNFVGSAFLDLIIAIFRYRWFLFLFVLIITGTTTVIALLSPKWYKSTTSVFPAEQTDFLGGVMGSGLSSLVKNFSPSKGLASLTGTTENDKYIAILKSSTVLDNVIKKFNLIKVYDLENTYYEKTVSELLSNLSIEVQDEGNLTITVYDKNPQLAADIANYLIEILNLVNSKLSAQSAKANRLFIENRYKQNLKDITDSELAMKAFQKKYGVVAVPEQLEGTVKQMAQIYADLAEKEIKYNLLKNNFPNEDHPVLYNAKLEIDELKKKIDQINTGNKNDIKLLIPLKQAPDLAGEYLKIYRNLEIQYKILEFITPLYEQAKVEENRATPSVVVLDKAAPAERKSKPKVSLYTLISFILSFGVALTIIFTKELIAKYKILYPEKYFILRSVLNKKLKSN